jgi:CelD/BcsL family acetyltransferase involved in cellulose biosynthesis
MKKNNDASSFTIQFLTTFAEIETISAQWDDLSEKAVNKSPLMSYQWLRTYFEFCTSDFNSWAVGAVLLNDELIAVLPLTLQKIKKFGLHVHVLSLPFNSETMSVDMLVADTYTADIYPLLIHAAMTRFPQVMYLHFRRIDGQSNTLHTLTGMNTVTEFSENGASLSNNQNFDLRRHNLPKNFKSNLNKAQNKAKRIGEIEFIYNQTDTSPSEQLDIVIDIEKNSWKGTEGTAIACSANNIRFYHALVQRLSDKGWLAIHYLKLNDNIIAANLGINFSNSLLLWKLGYQDEFKHLSPGGLLMEKLLQHVDGNVQINRIDLMTNESWYNNWNMQWRPFYDMYVYKKHPLAIYLGIMQRCKIFLKQRLKR